MRNLSYEISNHEATLARMHSYFCCPRANGTFIQDRRDDVVSFSRRSRPFPPHSRISHRYEHTYDKRYGTNGEGQTIARNSHLIDLSFSNSAKMRGSTNPLQHARTVKGAKIRESNNYRSLFITKIINGLHVLHVDLHNFFNKSIFSVCRVHHPAKKQPQAQQRQISQRRNLAEALAADRLHAQTFCSCRQ